MDVTRFNHLEPQGIGEAVLQIRDLMRSLISKSVEFVLDNNCAAANIYQIFTGRRTHSVVETRKMPYQHGQKSDFYYEILSIDGYGIGHVLSIRLLHEMDDIETICSMVSDRTWQYRNSDGDICFCNPWDYIIVCLSRLDIVNKGQGVYKLGFAGQPNDLPHDLPFPTLLINGEIFEDNDLSKLTRELLYIDYPAQHSSDVSKALNSVCDMMVKAVNETDQRAVHALIADGVHEHNNIPLDDILAYMEIPAVFYAQLRRDIDKLIELDLYKKRRQNL